MPKILDYAAKTFGDLLVVRQEGKSGDHRLWLCKCVCGRETLVKSINLRKGYTKSCGCRKSRSRAVDIGQKYGRLTAIERAGHTGGEPAFLFRCDCGKEKVINAQSVRRGITRSCGCLRSETSAILGATNPHPGRDGKAHIRYFLKNYARRARTHGIEFSLSFEEFEVMCHSNCFYCGKPPSTSNDFNYGSYARTGIDRKDSGSGYTAQNCVPCCSTCNYGKNVMDVEQFKGWIKTVYNYFARS